MASARREAVTVSRIITHDQALLKSTLPNDIMRPNNMQTPVPPYRLCFMISKQVSSFDPEIAASRQPKPKEDLFVALAPRSNNSRTMRLLPKCAATSSAVLCH